jgi:hydrogenase assembly chaperone HypC/HupF
MCLAVPGKIICIDGAYANVNIMGIQSAVNIQLIENPHTGDYILVHSGCGIQKIDIEYFSFLEKFLQEAIESQEKNEQS